MKRLIVLLILLFFAGRCLATHIAGGELIYEYLGRDAAGKNRYKITMRLFRECSPPPTSTGQVAELNNEPVNIAIYDAATLGLKDNILLTQNFTGNPPVIQYIPGTNACVTGNPTACYQVGTYSGTLDIAANPDGYILCWVRYTRTTYIFNANVNGGTGGTYTSYIPGTKVLPTGINNSPQFNIKDPDIICKQSQFKFDFSAVDIDGDSLVYKFAPAYDGTGGTSASPFPNQFANGNFPQTLQINELSYSSPYTAVSPLGADVTINPKTGLISGKAPPLPPSTRNKFVVCIAVEEWRNGVLINIHRKDFLLTIGDCSITAADLKPSYVNCKDLIFNFENESTAIVTDYLWNFGDTSNPVNTSTLPTPTHTYNAVGDYTLKLVVTSVGGCKDSATAIVKAYPGFVIDFSVTGSCYQQPLLFKDLTKAVYGNVDGWTWNFGDLTTLADTAHTKDTAWKYPAPLASGATVKFIATSSKGCIDSVTRQIEVVDKAVINLAYNDKLICSIDSLEMPLKATPGSVYAWTPNDQILRSNTANPTIFPKKDTKYYITVTNDGCVNRDSLMVNVLDFITVNAGPDTLVCLGDALRLNAISQATSFAWTASSGEVVAPEKNPLVKPIANPTTYKVRGNLGRCEDADEIVVKAPAYPVSIAGLNDTICYGNRYQINATFAGTHFTWSPTVSLANANTTSPVAGPLYTTTYTLTAYDSLKDNCPKPVTSTITVNVVPKILVNAGADTLLVVNQPLQLNATSNIGLFLPRYTWTPSTGLNNTSINNPVAILDGSVNPMKYIVRATTNQGCFGEDDIVVKVFKTNPNLFVPSAFTPNNDGINDIFKPIPAGITGINYFNIYNRYGQLIYTTTLLNKGWDGYFNGVAQPAGTYVYTVLGTDFTGKSIFRKGTVVLIR